MRFDLTVSQFTWELASGATLDVYDPDTWRPYCHIRDISKAIMTVLVSPPDKVAGEIFNVGDTAQQFTKRMIVEEAAKALGDISVSYREGDTDPRNYRVSFEKIAHKLAFSCDFSVEAYVTALVDAFKAGVFVDVRDNFKYGNYSINI
jgi:nucleoside-diphosphate-sugar epimerase